MAELHRGITMTSPALALLSPADKCTHSNGADRNGSHTPVAKKTVLTILILSKLPEEGKREKLFCQLPNGNRASSKQPQDTGISKPESNLGTTSRVYFM